MGLTFCELVKLADFDAKPAPRDSPVIADEEPEPEVEKISDNRRPKLGLGGLHYNIQIIMPESRDPKVYDALFRSLKEHLL